MDNKIKAILFDFDGTLVDFQTADTQALKKLCLHTGSAVSPELFFKIAMNETMAFHHLVECNQVDPLLFHESRLKNTCAQLDIPWQDNYITYYQELFYTVLPYQGAERLLQKLHDKFKTGLITNAYDAMEQRKRIHGSGLLPCFDIVVVAAEVGIYKPDPAIFHLVLDKLQIQPQQAIFIGDSIKHDIEGAHAAGMRTILINNSYYTDTADYIVSNLQDLDNLLSRYLNL